MLKMKLRKKIPKLKKSPKKKNNKKNEHPI